MDSSFTIKPRAGIHNHTRDPLPARKTIDTDLAPAKAVAAVDENGAEPRERRHDHPPHDVVVDPESREVINRENDIRTQSASREHPDQALARFRAYRPAHGETDPQSTAEPHANIKA
jgi:hypothetical protein